MHPDDERLAKASRRLRQHLGRRQSDFRAPRTFIQKLEAGRAGDLRLRELRDYFAELTGNVRITPWWNGAAIDRLLDEDHAAVVNAIVALLKAIDWEDVLTEASFNDFGDRGSIDVFAAHRATLSVFVGEAKSDWGSTEETLRRLDVKTRIAPKLARERFGFSPRQIATVLVFPESRSARRVAQRFSATLGATLPARNVEIRRWLAAPSGSLRGLMFLADASMPKHDSDSKR
jgi:hypothetical protein